MSAMAESMSAKRMASRLPSDGARILRVCTMEECR